MILAHEAGDLWKHPNYEAFYALTILHCIFEYRVNHRQFSYVDNVEQETPNNEG